MFPSIFAHEENSSATVIRPILNIDTIVSGVHSFR